MQEEIDAHPTAIHIEIDSWTINGSLYHIVRIMGISLTMIRSSTKEFYSARSCATLRLVWSLPKKCEVCQDRRILDKLRAAPVPDESTRAIPLDAPDPDVTEPAPACNDDKDEDDDSISPTSVELGCDEMELEMEDVTGGDIALTASFRAARTKVLTLCAMIRHSLERQSVFLKVALTVYNHDDPLRGLKPLKKTQTRWNSEFRVLECAY
ncbi:hypothetical protein BT69DRAFT_1363831 [Atractiella rhizophila]|nr:hypothetical protein BT69DRAFT_1363831 [Atractiella rhizophila]